MPYEFKVNIMAVVNIGANNSNILEELNTLLSKHSI